MTLHIRLVGGAGGIDPLCDLVDVPADGGQLGGKRLDVRRVGVDDVPVNRHLSKIGAVAPGWELRHLLVYEALFFLRDIKLHLDIPFSVRHVPPPFLHKGLGYPNKHFSHFRARDLKMWKIASGYSLAVLAKRTFPSIFPSTLTTIWRGGFGLLF